MPEGPEIRRAADSLEAAIKANPDGCLVCFSSTETV
jgi:Rad3-related DNA helicase